MTLKTRRFLYLLFIFSFLIATPVIIITASGYDLSFSGRRLVKTGILNIKTDPSGADVFLDGKPLLDYIQKYLRSGDLAVRTPAKIKHIAPGEHILSLKKNGYWDWQKKFQIDEGQSIALEDIRLFEAALPLEIFSGKIGGILPSPDGKSALLKMEQGFFYFKIADESFLASNIPAGGGLWGWSADSERAMAGSAIISASGNGVLDIASSAIRNAKAIELDPSNSDRFYYLFKSKVYSSGADGRSAASPIAASGVEDFTIKNDSFATIENTKNNSTLNFYDLSSNAKTASYGLPYSDKWDLIEKPSKFINLLDGRHGILYLFEQDAFVPLRAKLTPVKYIAWSGDSKLAFADSHEIWIYYPSANSSLIVARISDEITGIVWQPEGKFLVIAASGKLIAIEPENYNQEGARAIELVKFEETSDPFFGPDPNTVLFFGKIGMREGLFKLAI
jgi:hypothetical protein